MQRFQSVPTTWLEALLLSDHADVIKKDDFVDPSLMLPSLDNGFLRQNSSPLEFISHVNNSHDYFSGYGISPKASYDDYLSSSLNVERFRDVSLEEPRVEFTTEMSGDQSSLLDVEMEKLVQDSTPIRVRAKRGFATHPRSIAERVRRTRISDRIRKLQELVPNMDKQTNTADMLDEAVEYVKFLQIQIQDLIEHQNNCTCYS